MSEPSSIDLNRRSFIKAGAALAGSLIIDFAIPLGECPAFAQTAPPPASRTGRFDSASSAEARAIAARSKVLVTLRVTNSSRGA